MKLKKDTANDVLILRMNRDKKAEMYYKVFYVFFQKFDYQLFVNLFVIITPPDLSKFLVREEIPYCGNMLLSGSFYFRTPETAC